jgi:hypothetical protein
VEWWKKYFSDKEIEKVKFLLQENGKDDPGLHCRLLEKAALCRLSFATLKVDIQEARTFGGCPESVISQTTYGMKKSRPITAKWAFWTGYIVRRELEVEGKPPTSAFLSELITVLLSRKVTAEEVRTKFSQLRKDARNHATEAARILFMNNLFPDLCDSTYEADLRNYIENSYSESSQLSWFIVNGKIPEEHLKDIIKIRRSILMLIGIYGQLVGQEPIIAVDQASKIMHGIPIPVGGGFVFNSPIPKGTIHLEKANEIPFPEPFLQQTTKPIGQASINIGKDNQGGGTLTVNFPIEALTDGEPQAAAIRAVPAWLPTWQEYMPYPFNLRS